MFIDKRRRGNGYVKRSVLTRASAANQNALFFPARQGQTPDMPNGHLAHFWRMGSAPVFIPKDTPGLPGGKIENWHPLARHAVGKLYSSILKKFF